MAALPPARAAALGPAAVGVAQRDDLGVGAAGGNGVDQLLGPRAHPGEADSHADRRPAPAGGPAPCEEARRRAAAAAAMVPARKVRLSMARILLPAGQDRVVRLAVGRR